MGEVTHGSIWRERDLRFTRFVRIEDVDCGDGKVALRSCDEHGEPRAGAPRTRAKREALGKRYLFVRGPS